MNNSENLRVSASCLSLLHSPAQRQRAQNCRFLLASWAHGVAFKWQKKGSFCLINSRWGEESPRPSPAPSRTEHPVCPMCKGWMTPGQERNFQPNQSDNEAFKDRAARPPQHALHACCFLCCVCCDLCFVCWFQKRYLCFNRRCASCHLAWLYHVLRVF